MKQIIEMDDLKKELLELSRVTNDKLSRSSFRRWMVEGWIGIMTYFKTTLIRNSLKKHSKVQSMNTSVVAAVHNFLNYRIIQELGLTNDEANTKFDQIMTKHIGKIYAAFSDELKHTEDMRKTLSVNLKDNAGFLAILANITLKATDKSDIKYDMDLKERRFWCMVRREDSHIKYEKGCTIDELKAKYPGTAVEVHGIHTDVNRDDIVIFEELDILYRSLPADMTLGIKEMELANEFNIVAVSDQKFLTGDSLSFYLCRDSNPEDYQDAAEALAKNGIYNILTKDNVDGINERMKDSATNTMSNSLVVWDGHPSTFKLSSESNFQLIFLRHVDYDQTIIKSLKDNKFASQFINNMIQVSVGDNMFNVTASVDKMRQGITDDQRNLRESDTLYHDLVRKQPAISNYCIRTDGDVNITAKTEKSMRDGLGTVTLNSSHTMKLEEVVTKIVVHSVAFIKLVPENDEHTTAKFELIKEIKVPKITRSYEEEEETEEHSFYITPERMKKAAEDILIGNRRTEGPISSVSSVVNVKDLVSSSFGSVPPLVVLEKDETDIKVAVNTFSPQNIKEIRYHFNAGCTNGEELDASTVIKVYGSGKVYQEAINSIIIEMLNRMSLSTRPTDFESVREFKPLEYQTFNTVINNCVRIFPTKDLRTNQYPIILKLPRVEMQELIFSFESIDISPICEAAYVGIAATIISSVEYNPYFYIMLNMKYDIDSRFSNEIIGVWESYLKMLSPYTNLEKLVIHHYVMNQSKQKLLDTSSTNKDSEAKMIENKKKSLARFKNRAAYYETAIEQVTRDLDNGELDINKNYIVEETESLAAKTVKIDNLTKDKESLTKSNNTLNSKVSKNKTEIEKLKAELAEAKKGE